MPTSVSPSARSCFSPDEAYPESRRKPPHCLFEFDCLHPTDFTFRFTPELRWMWPERNEGVPGAEWSPSLPAAGPSPNEAGGFYVLHSDYPDLAGAVTIPGAKPASSPLIRAPAVYPVELKLHIDPARDRDRLFPLLMAVGTNQPQPPTRRSAHPSPSSTPPSPQLSSPRRTLQNTSRPLHSIEPLTRLSTKPSNGPWCRSSSSRLTPTSQASAL